MSVGGTGELGIIARLKPYLSPGAGGDDAAVVADATGFLVVSADMFVERVHFDLGWMSPEDVGWRSLALAMGDLAAKGADPAWATSSVAMPKGWPVERLEGLYRGMKELGQQFGLVIEGGDLSAIDGPAVVSLTVTGRTAQMPLARSQAQPGWSVGVTGPLGQAAVSLRERRAFRFTPLIEEGRRLNGLGLCCGDVSDGLAREMEKFHAMAGVGSTLWGEDVPRAAGASLQDALTSGEEAELVYVGPDEIFKKAGLQSVGKLTADETVRVIDARGAEISLKSTGYDHFA
ncbi:MAG TPA: thiamine-monophosphate kinase [Candidatus Dormibacteraeota bacterium]|nr:thiamine-monophosphate kinase [Candidatus Dormibacteraeota bacterium]